MAKNDALIQSQAATLKNLENQMGQLATELHNRLQGTLSSNTKNPRNLGKKHIKLVALRSGKILEPRLIDVEDKPVGKNQPAVEIPTPKESESAKTNKVNPNLVNSNTLTSSLDVDLPSQKSYSIQPKALSPPYLQRLTNVELCDVYEGYTVQEERLSEFETVALTKECSAFLQNKLPLKLKDPGSFTIPCNIGESYCGKALCDLGASINLMPKSIFKKLGIGEVRPTTMTLKLED
ncbi:hypothetical protein CXB51_034526 [Gossypium anomalum]|uniref:Aspartic peptidase DDI1-type domain-containing protein n=1 Tax=Gossypium anomalum TaxID=47600 RepID=A0A8J5Y1N1_9ROSI|nr:hypothetical protein CXB51_034526 [Gossypium anomalum]